MGGISLLEESLWIKLQTQDTGAKSASLQLVEVSTTSTAVAQLFRNFSLLFLNKLDHVISL